MSRLRRAARLAAWVVGLPLALGALMVALAIVYARTDRGRETVRKLAVAEARKTLPGLEIGAVGGDYVHDLSLRDVTVRDDRGGPAVHVDRISAHYGLAALLRHTVSVSELRIEGVAITARPDERGGFNLSHLTASAAPTKPDSGGPSKPSDWRVHVDRIVVSGVTGSVAMPDGRTGSLRDLRLDGRLRLDRDRVQANLDATVASLRFTGLFPRAFRLTCMPASRDRASR